MEFSFTTEERAFRDRVRGYYRENPPPAGGRRGRDGRRYRRGLAEHGWLTIHWPVEYGGQGAGEIQCNVIATRGLGLPRS